MNAETKRTSWIKWGVASVIALIGASGGAVAVLQYLGERQEKAEQRYQRELAEWEAFAPRPVGQNEGVEFLFGWFIDLDTGLVAMSLVGGQWDLRSGLELRNSPDGKRVVGTKSESLRANDNVEWANLGVVDFSSLGYRDVRDAKFQSAGAGGRGKYLYRSHPTAAPGPGHTFVVKTSDGNVAKVQIAGYEQHNSFSRKMLLRYEVFPVVADPPRPRRP